MTAVHTALDIRPAYEPKSYAEIVAADKERERKWRAAAQKRPVARKSNEEAATVPSPTGAPVERIWAHRFGPLTSEFLEWKLSEPLGFLKIRCREEGTDYDTMAGPNKTIPVYLLRKKLVAEVKERYGLSLSALGRLFNRDHTSILTILRAAGMQEDTKRENDYLEKARQVIALFNSGFGVKEISLRLNVPQSRVSGILDQHFPNRKKPRKMADYTDAIRECFDRGDKSSDIARHLEFDPSAMSKFIKRMGWTR